MKVTVRQTASIVDELEKVRHRVSEHAYQLFRTGDGSNSAEEYWLKAERELLWQPAVEVCQKDGWVEVRAAVAGVEPSDLDVTVTAEDLLIRGNRAHEQRVDGGTVLLCEFSRGQLFRAVHYPRPVDAAKVTAECRNGVLTVTAPIARAKAAKPATRSRSRR